MKVLLCGGGTAGHVSPAIAIADALKKKDSNTEFLFVGREGGEENGATLKNNYPLKTIRIYGIERKLNIENLKRVHTAIKSLSVAKRILSEFSPDIVIGTGGYVCWPIIRTANRMGIPTLIHESNATAGLVTRLLSKKCDRVLLGFESAKKDLKRVNNAVVVGNPVREGFYTLDKRRARKKLGISDSSLVISSFGGSGGSRELNRAIISLMKSYSSKEKNVYHIHSCGKKYYADVSNSVPELVKGRRGCIIKPYIEDMEAVLFASDIVITRCGAITLSELCAVGVTPIMIPSPNVSGNHQYKNAKQLKNLGIGILIEEKNLSERTLLDAVRFLCENPEKCRKMKEKFKKLHVADSAERIVSEVYSLVGNK